MTQWPHAPIHQMGEAGAYIVTAGTYKKVGYFNAPEKLSFIRDLLFNIANEYGWRLEAWAIMSNHYHFVALSPNDPTSLKRLISKLHTLSAKEINKMDETPGRKVWFQYWDTMLTYERSFLARLKYVHYNPVHHGIIKDATEYQWCSAGWFERKATPSFFKRVLSLKIDQVNVPDDF